ncbi:unnamed protein product, partial [Ectocarpus sp. 13 AM-2016]
MKQTTLPQVEGTHPTQRRGNGGSDERNAIPAASTHVLLVDGLSRGLPITRPRLSPKQSHSRLPLRWAASVLSKRAEKKLLPASPLLSPWVKNTTLSKNSIAQKNTQRRKRGKIGRGRDNSQSLGTTRCRSPEKPSF